MRPSDRVVRNPVYSGLLADPFVLKHNGRYYGFGTPAAGPVPVLTSLDLVSWQPAGTALPAPRGENQHWAPEVAYDNGTFYLYHSTGGVEGEGHQLRVATASNPVGPFTDQGNVLDPEDPFTIDAHPFRDDDGSWYLFYSRDFLDGERIGTGIVADRMIDMVTLARERVTVVRPSEDWHLYERARRWYGRVQDWYTVEGPFVRKRDGRYWCFFSGGAWRSASYGVGCAVADHPLGPYVHRPAPTGADVLRTVPGRVIGPGHASIVLAPDNVSEYLVYHAWDPRLSGRYMCIDRLRWSPDGPTSPGPTAGAQPRPPLPEVRHHFDHPRRSLDRNEWDVAGGSWEAGDGETVQREQAAPWAAAAIVGTPPGDVLVEVNLALRRCRSMRAGYGILLGARDGDQVSVELKPGEGVLAWRSWRGGGVRAAGLLGRLRPGLDHRAFHQLMLARAGMASAEVWLDGTSLGFTPDPGGPIGLFTSAASAAFAGVAVTRMDGAKAT
ncbi:MAG TPA: glycoside hydrolase family 43 protein [Acidimicrobiales bacterium]|nr:glycoside hydrolase family 43 protein [Acidimicrobiales bacterium]